MLFFPASLLSSAFSRASRNKATKKKNTNKRRERTRSCPSSFCRTNLVKSNANFWARRSSALAARLQSRTLNCWICNSRCSSAFVASPFPSVSSTYFRPKSSSRSTFQISARRISTLPLHTRAKVIAMRLQARCNRQRTSNLQASVSMD